MIVWIELLILSDSAIAFVPFSVISLASIEILYDILYKLLKWIEWIELLILSDSAIAFAPLSLIWLLSIQILYNFNINYLNQ